MKIIILFLCILTITSTHLLCFTFTVNNTTRANLTAIIKLAEGSTVPFEIPARNTRNIDSGSSCARNVVIMAHDNELQGKNITYDFADKGCRSTTLTVRVNHKGLLVHPS